MSDQKQQTLNDIVHEIFQLNDPEIENTREKQIADFIISAVNGDMPITPLVINASVDEKNNGAIVYIITNLSLIKIEISPKEVKSSSFPLNTLIGVERKLINNDQIEFSAFFQNGSFGLRYSQDLKEVTDFFQKIELIEQKISNRSFKTTQRCAQCSWLVAAMLGFFGSFSCLWRRYV